MNKLINEIYHRDLGNTLCLLYDAEHQEFVPASLNDYLLLQAIWPQKVVERRYLERFIPYAAELGYTVEAEISALVTREVMAEEQAQEHIMEKLIAWTETL